MRQEGGSETRRAGDEREEGGSETRRAGDEREGVRQGGQETRGRA